MAWSSRWVPVATGTAVAAALTGAAAITVERAGCDEPGTWRVQDNRVELVSGCLLDPADLPVTPPRNADSDPVPPVRGIGD